MKDRMENMSPPVEKMSPVGLILKDDTCSKKGTF